jgi:hypothetical protein
MRDLARIARIAAKLTTLWRVHPDMRLGQLVENICPHGAKEAYTGGVFSVEDDIMEARIDHILSTGTFAE